MNRLVRASGVAVSALTAATATILLLLPGRARLEYPEATVGPAGGAVTAGATAPSGNGSRGEASASERAHGLTVNGSGRRSRLSGAGDELAGPRSTGSPGASSSPSLRPASPPPSEGTRAWAATANPRASHRPGTPRLWLSDWTPSAGPPQRSCSAGVCTFTEGGWDGPDVQINGDHFNFGPVLVQIRRDGGTVQWSTTVTASYYPGFAGAALYARTPIGDCSGVPGTASNDYAIAYDRVSGRWSNEVPLDADCASR
jgi:hypothetical protein